MFYLNLQRLTNPENEADDLEYPFVHALVPLKSRTAEEARLEALDYIRDTSLDEFSPEFNDPGIQLQDYACIVDLTDISSLSLKEMKHYARGSQIDKLEDLLDKARPLYEELRSIFEPDRGENDRYDIQGSH